MTTEGAGLEISITQLRDGFTVEMADALRARMEAHPAREASERWHLLGRTLGAHAVNTDTLTYYLEEKERTVTWVLDDLFAHRMLAHLTNYLATAKMLVDHSRNMMKAYEGSDFAAEYERHKNELAGREDVQLVQGLRNYVLHQRSPAIGIHSRGLLRATKRDPPRLCGPLGGVVRHASQGASVPSREAGHQDLGRGPRLSRRR